MDFNSWVDSHRSQIKFYQAFSLGLIIVLGILAVVVPSSLKNGPYIIRESDSIATVTRAEPWKLTVGRIEGFLKLFLSARFEWSKESFEQKKTILKGISDEAPFNKLKDSITSYGAIAKSQDARGYYVLEGYRFSNEQKLIETQVSRVIRIGTTGVVTPLMIRITFEESALSDGNPFGLRVKAIEERDPSADRSSN